MSLRLNFLPILLTPNVLPPQRRQWHPTPVLWPGQSHGRRSLGDCRLWGRTEPDTTEQLSLSPLSNFHFHFSLSCIGDGNGNPLQCSCLENSRDSGDWRAAIYGVAQSQTGLKRLSRSSSREIAPSITHSFYRLFNHLPFT